MEILKNRKYAYQYAVIDETAGDPEPASDTASDPVSDEAAAALDAAVRLPQYRTYEKAGKRRRKAALSEDDKQIVAQMKQVEKELSRVENNFNSTEDPILIDYYIYEQMALHKKYEYLLRSCRERGLSL